LYKWFRSAEAEDAALDITATSTPPALLGYTVRDDHILVLLDIPRTNDLYVGWRIDTMTCAEQDLLRSCLAKVVGAFKMAKSYEDSNTLIKCIRSQQALHPAVKVAALLAGTWNPTDGSAPVLSEAELYQQCFRIAACVYYHSEVHLSGFSAVCKANANVVRAIVEPGDDVFN